MDQNLNAAPRHWVAAAVRTVGGFEPAPTTMACMIPVQVRIRR